MIAPATEPGRTPTAADARAVTGVLLALFFASGFAALLYQVAWQRLLTLVTGLDLLSVTVVVAAFMLGMGLGSLAAGEWADRRSPRGLLVAFAVAELAIAAFALASPALYHGAVYEAVAPLLPPAALLALAAASLLLPTFCMGVTLPLLARALTQRIELAPGRIGALYGWNTLGAAAGAWLGTALIVRHFGYGGSLRAGVAINVAAAAIALLVATRVPAAAPAPRPAAAQAAPRGLAGLPFGAWLAIYFTSGMIALGLEIAWFRLLGVVLKPTAFTFPMLLAFYLFGVGAGSLAARRFAERSRDPLRAFLACQAAIPLYAALSVAALAWLVVDAPWEAALRLRGYLASYEPIAFRFAFAELTPAQRALYLGVPALLVLPPTLLMGASFPFLQRCVQSDPGAVGRRVGRLQAANILGSVTGVVLVGVVLLGGVGTATTLRLLALCGGLFALALAWRREGTARRVAAGAAAVAVTAGAVAAVPAQADLWAALHGVPAARTVQVERASGVSVLVNEREDFSGATTVFVNGLGQSWVPFGGGHTEVGLLPALLHPAPVDVAVIGLGSGDTLFAVAGRPETRSVLSIEIIDGQLEALRELAARTGYGGLRSLLGDARIAHLVADGRGHLVRDDRRYDIVEADALRPTSAYAGHLYSVEYFRLLARRLEPGGCAVTWRATDRTAASFRQVFPFVAEIDWILVGSDRPIPFDRAAIAARAASAPVRDYYARAGIDVAPYAAKLLREYRALPPLLTVQPPDRYNTDLYPRDELAAR